MINIEHALFSGIGAKINNHKVITWNKVEPEPYDPPQYDWRELDKRVSLDQQAGLLTYFTVHSTSRWASDPEKLRLLVESGGRTRPPLLPQYYDQWERFVEEMVDRYDGDGFKDMPGLIYPVQYYQFGAEYAPPSVWYSGSQQEYFEEWRRFTPAGRRAYPEVKIVANGLASTNELRNVVDNNFNYDPEKAYSYYASLKGAALSEEEKVRLDGIYTLKLGFVNMVRSHPELFDIDDVRMYTYFEYEPERIPLDLQYVKDLHNYLGYQKPIFTTEGQGAHLFRGKLLPEGWPEGYTEQILAILKDKNDPQYETTRRDYEREKSIEAVKVHTMLFANGVNTFIWFPAHDTLWFPGQSESGYHWMVNGLTKVDERYKLIDKNPIYYTYGLLTSKLSGFVNVEIIQQGPEEYVYKCNIPDKEHVFVLWSSAGIKTVDLSPYVPSSTVKITHIVTELDADNNPVYPQEEIVATDSVDIDEIPIFVEASTATGIERSEDGHSIPVDFRLFQNYPNPFNPETTIRFALPHREHVTLKVFDVRGREVTALVDGELPPGEHTVVFHAKGLASSVYFYEMRAAGQALRRKLVLLR